MDKDDENYQLMCQRRDDYLRDVRIEAVKNGVHVTQWELEEIELAFENGFAHGYVAGKRVRHQDIH